MTTTYAEAIESARDEFRNPRHAELLRLADAMPAASALMLGAMLSPPMKPEAVRWVFWAYGIARGHSVRRRPPTPRDGVQGREQQRAAVLSFLKRSPGASQGDIMAATGVTQRRLARFLAEAGLAPGEKSGFTAKTRAKMLFWRDEGGWTYQRIADQLGGIATSTVALHLARARAEASGPRQAKAPEPAAKNAMAEIARFAAYRGRL